MWPSNHGQYRNNSTTVATVSITMRPPWIKCFSCKSILRKVEIAPKTQNHIIERHYPKQKHVTQSAFSERSIPHQSLFYKVGKLLRLGRLKVSKREGRHYIYYHTFPFDVGVYRDGRGGSCATKTVKIVCKDTKCGKCGRRWPNEVVTIYPYK